MNIVYYENIPKERLEPLKKLAEGYKFVPYQGQGQDDLSKEAALFFLGEGGGGLIHKVQKINDLDPLLSLLIFPSAPHLSSQLKMAVQFSPFINQNVKVVDTLEKDQLKALIAEEAERTITRKNFEKKKEDTLNRLSSAFKSDHVVRNKFLDNFLLQAPVGAVLLSKNNMILDINAYAKDLLADADAKDLTSTNFASLFQADSKKIQKLLSGNVAADEHLVVEIKKGDNISRRVQLHMSEIDTANAFYKMIVILDVTKEVIAEQKALDYLHEVEKRNKELKQFASVVSHDLKNPLSTIKLSCEMALGASMEDKDKYVSIIERSSDNLLQMIKGLEEVIDVRQDKKRASHLKFQQIFDKISNEYQYQVEKKEITITCDFDKAPSIAYIKSYLISIFHNMISNAIKYRKKEEPLKVHIETERKDPYVLLKFSDNGIGIDLDKNGKALFQPFKRFSKQADGKGIGLSIIKSMIEKNNGKIEVESTPGVGTTFLCFLRPF